MDILLQSLVNGMVLGSVYTLVAVGFAIVFSIMGVAILAHGEIYMIGAYVVWIVVVHVTRSWWLAIFAALVIGSIVGIGFEKMYRPVMKGNMFTQLLVGFGILITIQELVVLIFGPLTKGTGILYPTIREFGSIRISDQRIIIFFAGLVIITLVFLFFQYTRVGKAMRATASDTFAASCCGIGGKRMAIYAFILAGAITAAAGALLGPLYSVGPFIGSPMLIIALLVCVIGGLGSIGGAAIFGYIFGLIDSLSKTYMSPAWSYPVLYALFFTVLILRPLGLFGKEEYK